LFAFGLPLGENPDPARWPQGRSGSTRAHDLVALRRRHAGIAGNGRMTARCCDDGAADARRIAAVIGFVRALPSSGSLARLLAKAEPTKQNAHLEVGV
jgi:hypothetical protein